MPLRVCQDALGGHSLVYNSSHVNKLKFSHIIKNEWESGIQSHPKPLLQYSCVTLTAVATTHIGSCVRVYLIMSLGVVSSICSRKQDREVIFLYKEYRIVMDFKIFVFVAGLCLTKVPSSP
jgi:hypothetical protein